MLWFALVLFRVSERRLTGHYNGTCCDAVAFRCRQITQGAKLTPFLMEEQNANHKLESEIIIKSSWVLYHGPPVLDFQRFVPLWPVFWCRSFLVTWRCHKRRKEFLWRCSFVAAKGLAIGNPHNPQCRFWQFEHAEWTGHAVRDFRMHYHAQPDACSSWQVQHRT